MAARPLLFARAAALVGSLLGLAQVRPAHAADAGGASIPCGLVEAGSIHIDGLESDWEGVPRLDVPAAPTAGVSGSPLRLYLRCNYDDKALYLFAEVRDDILVRTPAAALTEDHIELAFATPKKGGEAVDRLLIFPALPQKRIARRARWLSGRAPRIIEGEGPAGRARPRRGPEVMEVYDTLLEKGYAVELRLPLALLPGYKAGQPLRMAVRAIDVDAFARPEVVAIAETSSVERAAQLSQVLMEEAQSALSALLSDIRHTAADISWEASGDIGAGAGRVLVVGRYLAVVGKEYGWQEAAPSREDIREARLIDPGDGLKAVALRTTEHGGGGSREVLRIYRLREGRFQVLFAAEIAKHLGAGRLSTKVSYEKRGRLTDIVLTPEPAVGLTRETWNEIPATDVLPILLPWQDRRARYVLKDGTYVQAK